MHAGAARLLCATDSRQALDRAAQGTRDAVTLLKPWEGRYGPGSDHRQSHRSDPTERSCDTRPGTRILLSGHPRAAAFTRSRRAVFSYIEGWYNTRRLHSLLSYLGPAQWEAVHRNAVAQAA